MRLKSPYNAVY
uniref:Uncharacterized protein n=1 Tax=Anguilla anguilla TaxID=7936 RepID=A0A0E9V1S7_ANGAN